MSNFDKVIGYDTIKNELLQICDMIHNSSHYEELGAKIPSGVLLHGEPGLGKTLMAKCFIETAGRKAFTIRKNKSENFVDYITQVFKEAKEASTSIIFLDDMDKFANEDNNHRDADEYVAVQAGIDEVKGSDVFVLATANDINKLPDSLTRSGRFDRKIEVYSPNAEDSMKIIEHYLSDKKISDDVNIDDLSKMITYSSCAELESILNEAAISAAYQRKECVEMCDLVKAVLREQYDAPDVFTKVCDEELRRVALHEAGHAVMSEIIVPGSVALASLRTSGRDSAGGFVRRCKELPDNSYNILICLAGMVAEEICYGEYRGGNGSDLRRAYRIIRENISVNATHGFGMLDVSAYPFYDSSQSMISRNEAVVQAELERFMIKVRKILMNNKDFLEKVADELISKETLLASDVKRIRERQETINEFFPIETSLVNMSADFIEIDADAPF